MTNEELLDALGEINDRYVEETAPAKKKQTKKWIAFLAAAACVVLAIAIPVSSALSERTPAVSPYNDYVVQSGAYACLNDSTYINDGFRILRCENDTRRVRLVEPPWDKVDAIYAGTDGVYTLLQQNGASRGLYRLEKSGSFTKVNSLTSLPQEDVGAYQLCGSTFAVQLQESRDIYFGTPFGDLTRIFARGAYVSLTLWKTTSDWVFAIGMESDGMAHVLGYCVSEARSMELYATPAANLVWIGAGNGAVYWNSLHDGFYCKRNADSEPVLLKASEELPVGAGIYDDRYMYLYSDKSDAENERGLYIYDLDCNLLAFLPAPEAGQVLSYAFTTENDVYFYSFSAMNSVPAYCIEKALIGTDELSWIPVDTSYGRN